MKTQLFICLTFFTCRLFGQLDPEFGLSGFINTSPCSDATGYDMLLYEDGKILSLGIAACNTAEGQNNIAMARCFEDGNFDESFDGGSLNLDLGNGKNDEFISAVLKPDGKILIAGNTVQTTTQEDFAIVQLNDDGTFDTSFGDNGIVILSNPATTQTGKKIMLQPDGKFLLAGNARSGLSDTLMVIRFLENGSLDPTFGTDGTVIVNYNENSERLFDAQRTTEGKIVVLFLSLGVEYAYVLARLNTDGSIDNTFGDAGFLVGNDGNLSASGFGFVQQTDGKLIVAHTDYDFADMIYLTRYLEDGSLDTDYGTLGTVQIQFDNNVGFTDIQITEDDAVILCGDLAGVPEPFIALCRVETDGTLNTIFGGDGFVKIEGSEYSADCIDISQDGYIYITGTRTTGGTNYMMIMRAEKQSTGIHSYTTSNYFLSLSPNPVSDQATLSLELQSGKKATIYITDITGKIISLPETVVADASNHTNYPLSFADIADGLYFVTVVTPDWSETVSVAVR